jgi:prefoldin beta subunit
MEAVIQEKINQMQLLQQNLQNFSMQRQQFQIQQTEIESALGELEKSGQAYKIIGNVMVLTDKDALKKELEEKKHILTIRISSIEKQESKVREKAEELQKEVLSEIEKKPKKKNENDSN